MSKARRSTSIEALRRRIEPRVIAHGVTMTRVERPYPVHGSSPDEWIRFIELTGPREFGIAHAAYTSWQLTWTSDGSVSLYVEVTLPVWLQRDTAPPTQCRRWNQFVDALRRHEETHVDNAIEAAITLHDAFARLVTQALDADRLEVAMRRTARHVVAATRRRDRRIDEDTLRRAAS